MLSIDGMSCNADASEGADAKRCRKDIPVDVGIQVSGVGVGEEASGMPHCPTGVSCPRDQTEYESFLTESTSAHFAVHKHVVPHGETAGGAGAGGTLTDLEVQVRALVSDAELITAIAEVDTRRLSNIIIRGRLQHNYCFICV